MLSAIVRGHRRKLSRSLFKAVPSGQTEIVTRYCVLFRLAVLLNRSRVWQSTPAISVDRDWSSIALTFPTGWSELQPLTHEDLEQEAAYIESLGIELEVFEESGESAASAVSPTPVEQDE